MPTLGSLLASIYLAVEGVPQESGEEDQIRLGKATFVSLRPNDGGYVRADTGGYQVIANFHSLRQAFRPFP